MKKFAFLVAFLAMILGCSSENKTQTIKIGATAGPHADVVEAVAREAKNHGIDIKVVEFSDYITPNQSLADGELDMVSYQHEPFLNNFNAQRNTNLKNIGRTILMRMGIYSDKFGSLNDLPQNAVVAIPNDPTNEGRALVLLQKAGLITLKTGLGFKATLSDIENNPKNLQFLELEAAQLPRSLSDADIAVITMNYVYSAGLDVAKTGLFFESDDEPLAVMILAVRGEDEKNETYQKIAKLFGSKSVKDYIEKTYKGTITSAIK